MRDLVGQGEPGGSRRKLEFDLLYLFLIAIIGLHTVMKPLHNVVIFRPPGFGNPEQLKNGATAGQRPPDRRQKARSHLLKGLTHSPDAASTVGIDVCED